ncbi:indolepyruvate ferredoxin oxidoreductase family protein [Sporichthya sp.]|uniref:indolepyruvate ferredoxin oxidoreductase family protein n=1 Tax=Sporichthya sp. TaxID=65475 RepID=UPI001812C9CA|nr:indolepyruvate ferredoxin oxidoreductase family protein [Sporichthya sp.]MBA3741960.1 indolepyruvate ferredoxin oxidoreductase family protein [Sporichthya sp.]
MLGGRYTADDGLHFLTGIGALVRLPLTQMRRDRSAGLQTRAFISGYPGSPLGGLDSELLRRRKLLVEHGIVHEPGINEELAATAVFGSQVATVTEGFEGDGVLGVWYGKAPGLDRAADAIRHANLAGTGPRSGVVALVGDDPACKSSSLPSASEGMCADLGMPILHPGTTQDLLDLGRHAVALSRASGLWVALKVVTAVADATATVALGPGDVEPLLPPGSGTHRTAAKLHQPFSPELERDLVERRIPLARAYGALNGLNSTVTGQSEAWLGIIAPGHTFVDLLEAARILGLEPDELGQLGIRVMNLRQTFPLDRDELRRFARGLTELLVIEEKKPFVEDQVRSALFGMPDLPRVVGKTDENGATLVQGWGALDADAVARVLRRRLEQRVEPSRLRPPPPAPRVELTVLPSRTAWFCAGCPHSSSTQVPAGSIVGTGIGCHALASRMDPARTGNVLSNTQMGGEGAQWVGAAPFLPHPHMFQNLGDGTLFHSGWLAIRFAVAADSNVTYKLLYNGAVSMTGGQDPVGIRSVGDLARGLLAEGVGRIIVTTDDPAGYDRSALPAGVPVWDRSRLIAAQEALAAEPGVTVLIHDQACAAELRRARKRGLAPKPLELIAINSRVCEGCGDCGVKSTCLSLHPLPTDYGIKTTVHQGSCNNDRSCLAGDCPSFLMVTPGSADEVGAAAALPPIPAQIPEPIPRAHGDETVIRMVGVGGTGVVTTAQILGMAAAFDGWTVHGLDQTGLSQKAGPVVSDLRISAGAGTASGRVSSRGIDLLLAFDALTAVAPENLFGLRLDATLAVGSTTRTPTGAMVGRPGSEVEDLSPLPDRIAGLVEQAHWTDAEAEAERLTGDVSGANLLLVGVAYQHGGLPVSAAALEQAIRENGVSVESNLNAFRWGRALAAGLDPASHPEVKRPELPKALRDLLAEVHEDARELASRRAADLMAYQHRRYAREYLLIVRRASGTGSGGFTVAVADNLHRLMAYKDEYEVARLHTTVEARAEVEAVGGKGARATVMLHPPALRAVGLKRKLRFGPRAYVLLRALAASRHLRGTPFDPFGFAHLRRVERALRDEYVELVDRLVAELPVRGEEAVMRIASLPTLVRGYETVKLANVERYRAAIARELEADITAGVG